MTVYVLNIAFYPVAYLGGGLAPGREGKGWEGNGGRGTGRGVRNRGKKKGYSPHFMDPRYATGFISATFIAF